MDMVKRKKTINDNRRGDLISVEEEFSELADINKRLKRKIFDLYTIFEISVHLNSMLNSDQLLDGMLLTCIGQMGVDGAAIFLANETKNDDPKSTKMPKGFSLKLECTKGINHSDMGLIFYPNRRLYHLLLTRKKPLTFSEVIQAMETRQDEIEKINFLEPALVIPMIMKNRIRGIITLTKKISGAKYNENDFEFLSILSNQLAVVVENSLLHKSEMEATRKLTLAQKQLFDAEKVAALGRLSASIAHEINNPLGIIKNYLLLMKDDIDDNKKVLDKIIIIQEEVNRISRIVSQLLDFYKPHKEEFKRVDIAGMLTKTVDVLKPLFKQSDIDIKLNKFGEKVKVSGSAEQLRQVIVNILINAKEVMPDGGNIEINIDKNYSYLNIEISDDGPGIPQDKIPYLFEPFYTTKGLGKGTGLGLSVSYGIIKNHGGNITVKNNEDKGAKFIISLPLREQE